MTRRHNPRDTQAITTRARELEDAAKRHTSEYEATIRQWRQWCEETGHDPLPAAEQSILRWMHSHYPNWSVNYVKAKGDHLRVWHAENGHTDPRGQRWKRYVESLKRDLGERREQQQVDAFTVEELHALNAVFREQAWSVDVDTVRARGAIAAAVLLNLPLHAPRSAPRKQRHATQTCSRITARDTRVHDNGDVTITTGEGGQVLLRADRSPYLVRCIREAIHTCNPTGDAIDTDTERTGPRDPDTTTSSPFTVNSKLFARIASRIRTHARPHGSEEHSPASGVTYADLNTATYYQNLPASELEWFLRTLNPSSSNGLMNSALLLTGVALARRHQDLREIDITHIQPGNTRTHTSSPGNTHGTPDTLTYYQPRSKTDTTRDGTLKTLHHTNPDNDCTTDQPCHPDCPVRALTDHLNYQTLVLHRTSGPLFASTKNHYTQSITSSAWRHTLKQAWKQAGLPPGKRISSRTMRITGATLAHQQGASIEDICALTDHRSPEMAKVYVRRHDPHGHHITINEEA